MRFSGTAFFGAEGLSVLPDLVEYKSELKKKSLKRKKEAKERASDMELTPKEKLHLLSAFG